MYNNILNSMNFGLQKAYLDFTTDEEYFKLFKEYDDAFTENLKNRQIHDEKIQDIYKEMIDINKNMELEKDIEKKKKFDDEFKEYHNLYNDKLKEKRKLFNEMKIIRSCMDEMERKNKELNMKKNLKKENNTTI